MIRLGIQSLQDSRAESPQPHGATCVMRRWVSRISQEISHTRTTEINHIDYDNDYSSNLATEVTSTTPQYKVRVPFNPKVPGSRPGRPTKNHQQRQGFGSHEVNPHDFHPLILLLLVPFLGQYATVAMALPPAQ
jgi:hypothetical protein